MKKAMIAMSGGVDSSVAAILTKNSGYECAGVMMRFSACPKDESADAARIAESLGIPFYLLDLSDAFESRVIDKFISDYENGLTPNPCIECNKHLKFEELFLKSRELGYDTLVTGHYARIHYDESRGRYLLKKGLFTPKDQSYVLYNMTQAQLSRTLFPLGELSKEQTRMIAEENGFVNSDKPDSQDICFIPDGDYVSFIKSRTKKEYPSGNFVDTDGNVLGRHRGIIGYTIGQRRGLGLALPSPMYVMKKDVNTNTVILCHPDDLFKRTIFVEGLNWIAFEEPPRSFRAMARIRYNQKETPCLVTIEDRDVVRVDFDDPQRAPTPGQAVVFYDADTVLGGGTLLE